MSESGHKIWVILQHYLHRFIAYLKAKCTGGKTGINLYHENYDGEKS